MQKGSPLVQHLFNHNGMRSEERRRKSKDGAEGRKRRKKKEKKGNLQLIKRSRQKLEAHKERTLTHRSLNCGYFGT
jgi:hypothetical protein